MRAGPGERACMGIWRLPRMTEKRVEDVQDKIRGRRKDVYSIFDKICRNRH